MNNNIMKSFSLRHRDGAIVPGVGKLYEEDFYINQQPPSNADRCFLHCFAYGETFWRAKHKSQHSSNKFNNYIFGDEYWAFEVIIDGDGDFICDKIAYKVKPHDVIIMRPGVQITFRTGLSGFLKKRSVLLKSPLLKYICETSGLAGINYIQLHDSSSLIKICDKLKEIIIEDGNSCQRKISTQSYAFLYELGKLAMPQQYPVALHRALDIIDANPYQDYTVESLSAKCQVSTSTLFRLFKNHLDTSPINYIIDRRLEQAKLLLNISDISLKEVAEKCGYKSESFLSRSFKKKFGMSPAKFRHGL